MTTFELKSIHKESVAQALAKAERYRLLNEPAQAESICLDVLRVDADNAEATVCLLLSVTDQFARRSSAIDEARALLPRLKTEYERAYFGGVIAERLALTDIQFGAPGAGYAAYEELIEAMRLFEQAEKIRPPGNDDAVLRWNTCARLLMRDSSLMPRPAEGWSPTAE